ncbi:MAG: GTP-binding protein [Thermoguttaceae bacterium]|jgi:G3E family GTPase
MQKTRVILVGGFLGAGKTTLVAKATEHLVRRGQRVGLVTNDQAANLVDTALLKEAVDAVQEVAGGCFCCRFDDLVAAMNRLVESGMPDVLIGEPVGSCTDLSATVLQPMKQYHKDRFQVAPFSVLVDVKQVRTLERLRRSMQDAQSPRFPENVMYIYEKQLEEADVIVLNKADLVSPEELAEVKAVLQREFSQAPVITTSALQGTGVARWLDHVMESSEAGRTITDVDYDEYAEGEAALGWLNAAIRLQADAGIDGVAFCTQLIQAMQESFQRVSAEVAHLKLHLRAGKSTLVANLTSTDGEPHLQGAADGWGPEAVLLVNVRARIDPAQLQTITDGCVQQVAGSTIRIVIEELQSFAPSRPQPLHRIKHVI